MGENKNRPTLVKTIRKYRFEIYLVTFCLFLFGSLFFPADIFQSYIDPLLILLNMISGFVLITMRRKTRRIYGLFFVLMLIFELVRISRPMGGYIDYQIIRLSLLSLFYTVVTIEIILQVMKAREVNKNVIFGVMGGYISLGLIAFFLLLGIHFAEPDSFRGLEGMQGESLFENLLYYAYITLMTIGYGDISPVKPLAQKAAVLIGLLGQFYLVIITAGVVGKYIGGQRLDR